MVENVNKTYYENESVNINEIESKIKGGRKWTKCENKSNEVNIIFVLDPIFIEKGMMTLASVMDSQNPDTKLRIHIGVVNNFSPENMLKIYTLRKIIRNDVEFNFYNSNRVATELKGLHKKGNAIPAKLLLPILLPDDVEKVILLDTGDLVVIRDLLKIYHWDMQNFLLVGVPDDEIGKLGKISRKKLDIYLNGGCTLINVTMYKEIKFYDECVKYKKYYMQGMTAIQSLYNDVGINKLGIFPF